MVAAARLGHARRQRLLGHLEQPHDLLTHLPHREGGRRVGVQALEPHAHVHAEEVAFLQDAPGRGDAVNDLLIDRCAQRRR